MKSQFVQKTNVESLRSDFAGLNRDELVRMIWKLRDEHELQIRRLEIESHKAEQVLASRLREVTNSEQVLATRLREVTNSEQVLASRLREVVGELTARREMDEKAKFVFHADRSALGKCLFRKDGRPKKPLRVLLFGSSGRPRKLTRRLVLKKDGCPRKQYREWMVSQQYQSLSEAYRF